MPRLPKWLLLKEWLTYDDLSRILENSPNELENILARDESEEFSYIYKFVCTFSPRECHKEVKEYRFEQNARQNMRGHLKEHIRALKANISSDKEPEFLTKNQMFQQSKAHKHKISANKVEVPIKKPRSSTKSDGLVKDDKEPPAKEKSRSRREKKKFTEIKQPPVDHENICQASPSMKKEVMEISELSFPSIVDVKSEVPVLKEEDLTPYIKDELSDLGLDQEQETEMDDDDLSDKISSETQTDQGKKERETIQYRIATKLFAIDQSQWGNIEKALDKLIILENASHEVTDDDKTKILEALKQWMNSVRLYNRNASQSLHDPLSPAEESILGNLTNEDWKRLDAADDPESKLRLTVYARMLLRDYVWYPRKLKPKTCRHCLRQYTASTSLYSHLVSLSGIRFWVCSKCQESEKKDDATFTRKHSLQYHILKEVGIPRYRCSQPGCSKTHNHTHHQKSHARQHTGEQYYKCEILGCNVRFSNRNTYSRHLLQNHNTELTSANQLRAIDKTEAQMKVYAARLKARERSKCKRQQCNEGDKEVDKLAFQDRALNQLVVNEAKSESDGVPSNLGKFMRPSASQLLYGIARDVRKTTSTIEELGKPADLGGLNLLATVSKYMNAENCGSDLCVKDLPSNVQSKQERQAADIINNDKSGAGMVKGSLVSVLSTLPSSSPIQVSSSTSVISGGQLKNAAVFSDSFTTSSGDLKSPSAMNSTPNQRLIVTKELSESISTSSAGSDENNSDVTVEVLGKKLILKPPRNSSVMSPAQNFMSSASTVSSISNEKPGKIEINFPQSQEFIKSASVFSNIKDGSQGVSSSAMQTPSCHKSEGTSLTNIVHDIKNDNPILQSKISPPNLQLRSISSVSGKTYIILSSSPKGNYVHNLPILKDSESTASGQHIGTALPLS